MVSAKRIESFDFATMYRVFNNGFSYKIIESFDFATMYRVFNNGFS